jgi:competence protein ComEA
MRVYISGEVKRPDVYELLVGAILQDAVQAAGGFTEAADEERLPVVC